jgi:quercetin dioxygenase-like cupin family protein
MELSERIIKKFEEEVFASVYEWQDAPGKVYEKHAHKGRVSIFVTDGSITFTIFGESKLVLQNERFDIPSGVEHSAIVGPKGCIFVTGEEVTE